MPTIATVTPNPSIDLLFEATRLVWDDANRVEMPRRRAGGQGVNVVRAAAELSGDPAAAIAIAPLGGAAGRELRELLEGEGTPVRAVPIAGETRVFCGVRETGTGRSMLINPRGPVLFDEEAARLLDAVDDVLQQHRPAWLAACGSLARGLPSDFYARVGQLARARGVAFVPDGDGDALRLAAQARCDLLVPNQHEAARLLGGDPAADLTPAEAAAAAAALRRWAPLACITLGAAGAVCADGDQAWYALPPSAPPGSAVGAGDVFLAAFILARSDGAPAPDALRRAVAAGTAVLSSRGTDLVGRDLAAALEPQVRLERMA